MPCLQEAVDTPGLPHMQCIAEKSMQAKNCSSKMSCMMDGLSDTFFVLPVWKISVCELLLQRTSNLLKQKNEAAVLGIICLLVKLNHANKVKLSSGSAGHCSLIISWYVHQVISERTLYSA